MPRGLPRSFIQRARQELGKGASFSRIFKRAWQLYKQSKIYPVLKGSRKKNPGNPGKRGGGMTRRRRRRKSRTIPLAAVGGAVAGVFMPGPGAPSPYDLIMQGDFTNAFRVFLVNYTGFNTADGSWDLMRARGLHAAILGVVAHKIAGWLGINRALGRARIPLIRI